MKIGDAYTNRSGDTVTIVQITHGRPFAVDVEVTCQGTVIPTAATQFSFAEIQGLVASGAWVPLVAHATVTTGLARCICCGKPNEYQPGPYRCHECGGGR